jgi:hypothetical protein
VLILLRLRTGRGDLTGPVRYQARPGRGGLTFDFEIIRLWRPPVEAPLAGPLEILRTMPASPALLVRSAQGLHDGGVFPWPSRTIAALSWHAGFSCGLPGANHPRRSINRRSINPGSSAR